VTVPKLSIVPSMPADPADAALVVAARKTEEGPALATVPGAVAHLDGLDALGSALAAIGVSGSAEEVRRVPAASGTVGSIVIVGVGTGDPSTETLRRAAGAVTRQVRDVESLLFAIPVADEDDAAAILEGAAIGAYSFAGRKSSPEPGSSPVGHVALVTDLASDADVARRASVVAGAVHTVRDLVNAPANELYPETLASRAEELVAAAGSDALSIDVLDEHALRAGEYGGILGVGQGSSRPPRLVRVEYAPDTASQHLALVGKGITFDTGGNSLKPAASMVGMKYDMTGAATVLAVTIAAARLELPIRVTAYLCIAENMPGPNAMRPGDVIRIKGGTTVEVLNTDAEGRLVMADGLVAASETRPDAIVDVATLTGAARQAFGSRITVAMGDEAFTRRVIETANAVGEAFWAVPIGEEFRPMLASDVADLTNVKIGAPGGMLVAGAFLQEFVGRASDAEDAPRIPWTHLDIAGTANNDGGAWGYVGKGPTGVAVRTLVALAESMSAD